jgi:hypothetical protein
MRIPSLSSWMLALSVLGASRAALASPTFPPVVQDELGLSCTPQCLICHTSNEGGYSTIGKFGLTLIGDGAVPGNDDSVRTALRWLEQGYVNAAGGMPVSAPNYDSDHDGIPDLVELRNGDLPGVAGPNGQGLACSAVRYGCGARVAPSLPKTPASLGALGTVLLLVGARLCRRRSSRR